VRIDRIRNQQSGPPAAAPHVEARDLELALQREGEHSPSPHLMIFLSWRSISSNTSRTSTDGSAVCSCPDTAAATAGVIRNAG
jgi:hypothetical protein